MNKSQGKISMTLRGAEASLAASLRRALGFWAYVTEPLAHGARDVIDFLQDRGYHWFEFRANGTLSIRELRIHYGEVNNFLAIPEEMLTTVQAGVHPEPLEVRS